MRTAKSKRMEIVKRILKNRQHEEIDGYIVDVQTANLLDKVYEALGSKGRSNFDRLPIKKLVDFAWKATRSASSHEIESAAPKMKKPWKAIPVGGKFKHKRQKYIKLDNNSAVNVKQIEKFRNTGLEGDLYEMSR